MNVTDEGAAFRSTLQYVQTTMFNNDRYEELEKRLVDQSRKAIRDRTEIEKKHYEEQKALELKISSKLSKNKKKENELKKILRERENEINMISREAKKYRKKFQEVQNELEATRSYAQQLVSFHVPENNNSISNNTIQSTEENNRNKQQLYENASSLTLAAQEIIKLKEENITLKETILNNKNENIENENIVKKQLNSEYQIKIEKMEKEFELSYENKQIEYNNENKALFEKELENKTMNLENQVSNLQDMLGQVILSVFVLLFSSTFYIDIYISTHLFVFFFSCQLI